MKSITITGMTPIEAINYALQTIKDGASVSIMIVAKDSNDSPINLYDRDVASEGIEFRTHLNPDNDLTFGKAISSEITMHIIKSNQTNNIDWTKDITVRLGIKINNSTIYTTLGKFYGDEPIKIKSKGFTTLEYTGYDSMVTNDIVADDFVSTLTFPMTTVDIRTAIENYYGKHIYNFAGGIGINIVNNPFPTGCTLRDILSWLAEAHGGYATVYQDVRDVQFICYQVPTRYNPDTSQQEQVIYTLTKDNYYELEKSEIEVPPVPAIVYIDTSDSSNNLAYPSTYTGVPYKIINNPLLSNAATGHALNEIQDMKDNKLDYGISDDCPVYIPMRVEAIGNYLVEAGDIIYVEDYDGNTIPMRIFSRTLTWSGGICHDVYECTGSLERIEVSENEMQQYRMQDTAKKVATKEINNIIGNYVPTANIKNNLTTSTAGYVLDARQGKALEDNKLDKVSRSTISSNNGTAAITIANNAAHMIVIAGNNNGNKGVIIAISNASGSVTYVNVNTMSGITVTTGTNKITLKNTTSNNCYAYDFVLTDMY